MRPSSGRRRSQTRNSGGVFLTETSISRAGTRNEDSNPTSAPQLLDALNPHRSFLRSGRLKSSDMYMVGVKNPNAGRHTYKSYKRPNTAITKARTQKAHSVTIPTLKFANQQIFAPEPTVGEMTARENEKLKRYWGEWERGCMSARSQRDSNQGPIRQDGRGFQSLYRKVNETMERRKKLYEVYIGRDLREGVYIPEMIDGRQYTFFRFKLPTEKVSSQGSGLPAKSSSMMSLANAAHTTHAEGVPSKFTSLKVDLEIHAGRLEMVCSFDEMYVHFNEGNEIMRGAKKKLGNLYLPPSTGHRSMTLASKDILYDSGYIYFSIYSLVCSKFQIRVSVLRDNSRTQTHGTKEVIHHQGFGKGGDGDGFVIPTRLAAQRSLEARLTVLRTDKAKRRQFEEEVETIRLEYERERLANKLPNKPKFNVSEYKEHKVAWRETQEERRTRAYTHYQESQKEKTERLLRKLKEKNKQHKRSQNEREERRGKGQIQLQQRKWMMYMVLLKNASQMKKLLKYSKDTKETFFRKKSAAVTIQRFVRTYIKIKRRIRARRHVKQLQILTRMLAINSLVNRHHQAADLLKKFLEQTSGVESISRIVKNFRHRILLIQKLCRDRLTIRRSRLTCWTMQWCTAEAKLVANGTLTTEIPAHYRDQILNDHMDKEQIRTRKEMPDYRHRLMAYNHHIRLETARKMVGGGSHDPFDQVTKITPPKKPHVPAVLSKSTVNALLKEGIRVADEYLNKQGKIDAGVKKLEARHKRRAKRRQALGHQSTQAFKMKS